MDTTSTEILAAPANGCGACAQHGAPTPGNWRHEMVSVFGRAHHAVVTDARPLERRGIVALTGLVGDIDEAEAIANAQLFTTVPALQALAQAALDWSEERGPRDLSDAALLKAAWTFTGPYTGPCEGCDGECDEPCATSCTVEEAHQAIDKALEAHKGKLADQDRRQYERMQRIDDKLKQMRGLLLWALYHHQGGSSPVGQPIRRLLRIEQHELLTPEQIEQGRVAASALAGAEAVERQPEDLADLAVADLLDRAELDSDPVSCFTDGTGWSDAGAMALIVKPGQAKAVHDLLAAHGFITPGKPVADAQQPAAEAA